MRLFYWIVGDPLTNIYPLDYPFGDNPTVSDLHQEVFNAHDWLSETHHYLRFYKVCSLFPQLKFYVLHAMLG